MKREMIFVNQPDKISGLRVVQDGQEIADALAKGEEVMHWESGDSMFPILVNMEYCHIKPCKPSDVKVGDAVFCAFGYQDAVGNTVKAHMVHRVGDIVERDETLWFKIVDTETTCFGWTNEVLGLAYSTNIFQRFDE